MSNITFARTRFDYYHPENGYGSYYDWWRLVQLSGFPTCYIDEIDASDPAACYIFGPVNGEIKNGDQFMGWPEAKAKIILWNLEQDDYGPIPGVIETWVSDAAFAERIGARYVLMGSHPGLVDYPDNERAVIYDVIMLAYMTPRREQIAVWLTQHGLTCAPNGWYQHRHANLLASSAMLHVHQNDRRYCAPQRFALAAAYRLPVITETLDDWGLFNHGHLLMSDYYNLPEFIQIWTRRNGQQMLDNFGWALHQYLCVELSFKRQVEGNV